MRTDEEIIAEENMKFLAQVLLEIISTCQKKTQYSPALSWIGIMDVSMTQPKMETLQYRMRKRLEDLRQASAYLDREIERIERLQSECLS